MDTTTSSQRAYFHTLRYLISEAERPTDADVMRPELRRLYTRARKAAKLKRVSWDEWQARQEQLLLDLLDEQSIDVPPAVREDLLMAIESA